MSIFIELFCFVNSIKNLHFSKKIIEKSVYTIKLVKKTRLKITSVITRVHKSMSIRTQGNRNVFNLRITAVKQLANFSARLAGKAAGQGSWARLPGKAAGHYAKSMVHSALC
jgi:hypothetical protein